MRALCGWRTGSGLGGQPRILDPRLRKSDRDPCVERSVGILVDGVPSYAPLRSSVSTTFFSTRAETSASSQDEVGSSLKRRAGGRGRANAPGLDRGRVAEAHRGHERQRPRLAANRLVERHPGLAEGEVERSAFVSPHPVGAELLQPRAARPEPQPVEELRKGIKGV